MAPLREPELTLFAKPELAKRLNALADELRFDAAHLKGKGGGELTQHLKVPLRPSAMICG